MTILPFLVAIIGVLLATNMKSVQSLQNAQLMQSSKKIDGIKVLAAEDKIYENAVNDYCRKVSIDGCWSGVNADQTITLANIEQYKPATGIYKGVTLPFKKIAINQKIGAIEVTHEFASSTEIAKYQKHSSKKGETIVCAAGTFPACTNNEVVVKIPLTQNIMIQNFTTEGALIDSDLAANVWSGHPQSIVIARRNDLTQALNTLNAGPMTRAELISFTNQLEASAQEDYKTLQTTL